MKKKNSGFLFKSSFLNDLRVSFLSRSKALNYNGVTEFQLGTKGAEEWFFVRSTFVDWPSLSVEFNEKEIGHIWINFAGEELWADEGQKIYGDSERVVSTYESILALMHQINQQDMREEIKKDISNLWKGLSLNVIS